MDEQLTCSDCRTPFNFSAGEQAFYAERGYQKPRRCKGCRAKRKAVSTTPTPASAPSQVQWTNGDADAHERPRRKTFGRQARRDHTY